LLQLRQSRAVRAEWFDEVRWTLDDDGIARFLSAGQTMTTDEAVVNALQPQEPATSDTKLDAWPLLTAREQEVAKLVARQTRRGRRLLPGCSSTRSPDSSANDAIRRDIRWGLDQDVGRDHGVPSIAD
jgi:hypothetical protein